MILAIILLPLIILSAILLIFFGYYIFLPSLKNQQEDKDPFLSESEYTKNEETEENLLNNGKRALVLCNCKKKFSLPPEKFNKNLSCFIVNSTNGSGTDCKFACLGLGDCVRACPQKAIVIKNNTAVVSSLCIGCGKCIEACPLGIIQLVASDTKKKELCLNSGNDFTSCDAKNKEEKISWNNKKGFKIWENWYSILKHIKK